MSAEQLAGVERRARILARHFELMRDEPAGTLRLAIDALQLMVAELEEDAALWEAELLAS